MNHYNAVYEEKFVSNLRRYGAMRQQIKRRVDRVLENPYANTESLTDATGRLNLWGCRSARIDRNFRLIFVICEECRPIAACDYCFCEDQTDQTVVFLTVGPHDLAYGMK